MPMPRVIFRCSSAIAVRCRAERGLRRDSYHPLLLILRFVLQKPRFVQHQFR